jgi:hypothetical protein
MGCTSSKDFLETIEAIKQLDKILKEVKDLVDKHGDILNNIVVNQTNIVPQDK